MAPGNHHHLAMTQPSLPLTYPTDPGFKVLGPSRDTAERIRPRAGKLMPRVLMALAVRNMTADEIAASLGENPLSIRPRCSQWVARGVIVDSGERRPSSMGQPSTVWRLK